MVAKWGHRVFGLCMHTVLKQKHNISYTVQMVLIVLMVLTVLVVLMVWMVWDGRHVWFCMIFAMVWYGRGSSGDLHGYACLLVCTSVRMSVCLAPAFKERAAHQHAHGARVAKCYEALAVLRERQCSKAPKA